MKIARLMMMMAVLGFSHSAFSVVNVGKNAPGFTLTGDDGKKYSLSDFKGKTVVLEWWNYKCPFVKKHYESGNMQGLQKKYTGKNVVWLVVNSSAKGKQGHVDGKAAMKVLGGLKSHQTKVLLDHDGKVGKLYGAKTTPHMYVINPQGQLIYKGAIDDNSSADKDDIPGAKNYVAMALDAHLKGAKITKSSTKPYGCSVKY